MEQKVTSLYIKLEPNKRLQKWERKINFYSTESTHKKHIQIAFSTVEKCFNWNHMRFTFVLHLDSIRIVVIHSYCSMYVVIRELFFFSSQSDKRKSEWKKKIATEKWINRWVQTVSNTFFKAINKWKLSMCSCFDFFSRSVILFYRCVANFHYSQFIKFCLCHVFILLRFLCFTAKTHTLNKNFTSILFFSFEFWKFHFSSNAQYITFFIQ